VSGLKYGTLEDAGIPLSELYDVVVLTGVPIHEIFGHHFEEPLRFLEFGESGTFKAGQNITNKSIVLKDDPTQKINELGVLGFSNFDAYGRRRLPRVHIQNGKVVEFLGSEYADNTDKLKQYLNLDRSSFVGNAVQSIDGSFPQPRMSCTVFDGPASKKDLEGKILLVPHEGHTRATDKTYLLMSFECYVVKNGEPQRVIPLQVTGGINQALANIELLDDMNYQTGMCGKSDPINNSHDSRVPSSQISRSQIWRGQQVYPLPISDRHLKILSRGYNG
jgi:predicted Zn-dependent protease